MYFSSFIGFRRPFTFSCMASKSSTQWIQWYVHAILIGFHHQCLEESFRVLWNFHILSSPSHTHTYQMPNAWLPNELKLKCWHHSSVEFFRPRTMFSLNIILRIFFFFFFFFTISGFCPYEIHRHQMQSSFTSIERISSFSNVYFYTYK